MLNPIGALALDHVGFVVHDPEEHRRFFEDVLNAEFLPGPQDAAGFNACQWNFLNNMKIEFLQPARADQNPFAAEFIKRHGPGVHHLTFQVPDLLRAMTASEQAGLPILYQNTDNPGWKEAFIHPKNAFGTVIQLAEFPEYRSSSSARSSLNASLSSITLAALEREHANAFFTGVLGGKARKDDPNTITWSGPVEIELVQASSLRDQGIRRISFESRSESFASLPDISTDLPFSPGLEFSFTRAPAQANPPSNNA